MFRWFLGAFVVLAASGAAAWWWLNRPLLIRHPNFGTDCRELVSNASLNRQVDCVRVWYGTNRRLVTDETRLTTDAVDVQAGLGESGDQLRLGRADVWLPKLVDEGGSRQRGETPHVQGALPTDSNKLAEYVFLTRITTSGRETFTSTLQSAIDFDGTDSVLLFVHGFNVKFDEALVRTAQLSHDLSRDSEFNVGVPVLYSWPSAGALSLDDYQGDQARSFGAAPYLEEFLDILTEDLDTTRINIIAHSMGNRVLTKALEDYARDYLERHNRDDLEFRILLVAADVERGIFDAANGVFDNLDANVTIYTSDTDRALHVSNIVNENDEKRLGDTDTNRPYIRSAQNYQTIDATAVTTELFGIGHNYYSDNPTILWDMMCTIAETQPEDRALEVARFGGLPDGEPYYRVNASIDPNSEACTLHRTAFPASAAASPRVPEERAGESAAPPPPPAPSARSMPAPAKPAPEPEPEREPIFGAQSTDDSVEFLVMSFEDTDLTQYLSQLQRIRRPGQTIETLTIRVYTDTVGSSADALEQTQSFANIIADWFVSDGVAPEVITAQGMGDSDLFLQTEDEVFQPLNRRVVITATYAN